ncbi:MAG: D-Ala-D-Ala carboxypeptidase family metallohydrolase [Beijerinckiaceae bacterium]
MPGQYLASIQAQDQSAQRAKLAEAERLADNQTWQQRFDYAQAHKPADIPPILRDAQAWVQMTPEQRAAYQQMQEARSGPITVSLPGDRIYSGPRSGLADALRGGGVGGMQPGHVEDGYRFKGGNPGDPSAWEPVSGGPTQPASGTFRPAVRGAVAFDPNPPRALPGGIMTSGRRTPEGNRLVGGVADSRHLSGNAVDYDGPDLPRLAAEARRRFPGAKVLIHDGHVHVEHEGIRAPYFGARGTTGLRKP